MRTRNSTKSTNNPTKLPHYDVTENFVEEERPDNSKVESKTRRRNRGKLEKLHNLPLDIVLEIYSYLEPLDILRLSRTSKDMRTFLMTRNNAIIWRKARLNVPDLPPLLEDISSEPQYASLVFESYCHVSDQFLVRRSKEF
ncbi:hypothetical protein GYMLUDRAFT_693142 [Collybiopsis luxurians FD-317 M1]|uniref:F-box domain-containing protein n=1 Tax=Collybiopsis luxurians FD-317 M1 TaxID=944289 RepID=A0A0D0C810_9AGAR|nr:hypothetical protein GYMLUDRAFT_693142 [Collybiopsis luxurians FD-317 M1]